MVELKLYKLVAVAEIHLLALFVLFKLINKDTKRIILIFSGGAFSFALLGLLYRWYQTISFEMMTENIDFLAALFYHPPFATAAELLMILITVITLLQFVNAVKSKELLILIPGLIVAIIGLSLPHTKGIEVKSLNPQLYSILFFSHTLLLFVSYGFFMFGFSSSILLFFKRSEINEAFFFIRTGFALFTVGLALGFYWGWLAWGTAFSTDPKVILSCATWLLFAASLHRKKNWSDRISAVVIIAGFLSLILTSLGVGMKLFGESTHAF